MSLVALNIDYTADDTCFCEASFKNHASNGHNLVEATDTCTSCRRGQRLALPSTEGSIDSTS